jgi:hypothetical protein
MSEDRRPDEAEQLAELASEVLEQATAIRRQWSDLAAALGVETADEVLLEHPAGTDSHPAKLVALDMLLSGRPRAEIESHLRATFGEDADRVVDAVYEEYDG